MSKIGLNMDSLKQRKDIIRHKLKPGENVFRFLPPFGEQANGYAYKKYGVIWGLVDQTTGKMRPYNTPLFSEENRCPVFEYLKLLNLRIESKKSELKAQGLDDEAISDKLESYIKLSRDLKPKTVFAYNAIDKSGVVGVLELKKSAHDSLKEKMAEYITDYNQDPTSLNSAEDDSGVWFKITRKGSHFNDTEYLVDKNQTKVKVGGQLTFMDDRSALPDAISQSYENHAVNLFSLYKTLHYDELKTLLMDNLSEIASQQDLDLGFPGFELSSTPMPKVEAQPKPAQTPKSQPTAKSKPVVTLKLEDSQDDELDELAKSLED